MYRVAQEALTNITKHACPERVEVHLGYEPCGTRLTVKDFAMSRETPHIASNDSGYGLTGMRERAELLGGELTTAMTREGFRVELRVPASASRCVFSSLTTSEWSVKGWLWCSACYLTSMSWAPPPDGDEAVALAAELRPTSSCWICGCPAVMASRPGSRVAA